MIVITVCSLFLHCAVSTQVIFSVPNDRAVSVPPQTILHSTHDRRWWPKKKFGSIIHILCVLHLYQIIQPVRYRFMYHNHIII